MSAETKMTKTKEIGYAVWHRSNLRNSRREKVGETWVARSDRRATLSLEMARAFAADLTNCGVAWEIRDKLGVVVESWEPPSVACPRCESLKLRGVTVVSSNCGVCGNTGRVPVEERKVGDGRQVEQV